jgi:hypothetical protein
VIEAAGTRRRPPERNDAAESIANAFAAAMAAAPRAIPEPVFARAVAQFGPSGVVALETENVFARHALTARPDCTGPALENPRFVAHERRS